MTYYIGEFNDFTKMKKIKSEVYYVIQQYDVCFVNTKRIQ